MPGTFYIVGLVVPSNSGRSFRVFVLDANGKRIFIGLVSRRALSALLQRQVPQADICKCTADSLVQEPLSFSLELKP